VLTRLHARYAKDSLGDDIVFRPAAPLEGGREWNTAGGTLERGAKPWSVNNFQARYAIRHRWQGAATCEHPTFGVWGGPPADAGSSVPVGPRAASGLAYAPRGGVELPKLLREDVPELALKADFAPPAMGQQPGPVTATSGGGPLPPSGLGPNDSDGSGAKPSSSACGCDVAGGGGAAASALAGLGLLGVLAARRRRRL
jgi:MYXO-CTERM domain-containing protein